MTIKYRLLDNGAFIAGDTKTGRTVYAYPTSEHASLAYQRPFCTALRMMASENAMGAYRDTHDDYDLRNWYRLNSVIGK